MAKYAGKDIVIEFDNASGSLQNMTQYILTLNDVTIEAILEQSHTFGDSWVENLFAGLRQVGDMTLGGFYDDTASTGPDVIFNDVGNTGTTGGGSRTFKVTWGSTKTTSVEVFIKSYKRTPTRGALTKFEVVLVATGAVTEA